MAYTDEELLECLTQLADELGEPPTKRQCNAAETTPSSRTFYTRFGGWNAALEAAELSVNQENPSYTDDELIDALCEFARRHSETPTITHVKEDPELPSTTVYRDHFGNWNAALEAAGLSVNQENPHSDDELIACLQEFAERLGETPTMEQVNHEPELPSATVYRDHFGSWNTALEAAGLGINQESSFTDAELLSRLQEFATELGHTPSTPDIDNRTDLPSAATYVHRFDSWNEALEEAGLTPNREVDRYDGTDEELLEMLREFAAELDTSPTQEDVDFVPDLPNSGVFRQRFGGWNEAKRQAGLATHNQPNRYTDAELIQELRRVSQTVEGSLTSADIEEADAPCSPTYDRRFGSWSTALEAAGLETTQQAPTQ